MPEEEGSPTTRSAALSPTSALDRLLAIMAKLRDPVTGCEWDSVQTFATIAPYTIEEAYEVADACARGDMADLKDELGDLLLQVVFHARMAEETGAFAFADVATAIADKMERRHPHLFGAAAEGGHHLWEQIKAEERGAKGHESALDGVALALPALQRAEKLQKRAARTGFDWPDPGGARAKIDEEIAEVEEASADERAEEIGDLLFAVVNWARKLDVDAEAALRAANAKFERRFRAMEDEAGEAFASLDLEAQEALWVRAKASEGEYADSSASSRLEFTRDALLEAGFVGWIPFADVRPSPTCPRAPGVYVVAYTPDLLPEFRAASPAGRFKGKDPTVDANVLTRNWVENAEIVYIGKAVDLRRRLIQFADFGDGKPVGHWGGRVIWQLPYPERLIVAWLETPTIDPEKLEGELLARFRDIYGRAPFANDPRRMP